MGEKSKDFAWGHKVLYTGNTGRDGVAVVIVKGVRESIVGVKRKIGRVMSIKLRDDKITMTVINAEGGRILDFMIAKATALLYFYYTPSLRKPKANDTLAGAGSEGAKLIFWNAGERTLETQWNAI